MVLRVYDFFFAVWALWARDCIIIFAEFSARINEQYIIE